VLFSNLNVFVKIKGSGKKDYFAVIISLIIANCTTACITFVLYTANVRLK